MQVGIIHQGASVSSLWGKSIPVEGISILQKDVADTQLMNACDVIIDFDFETNPGRIEWYRQTAKPVLIASCLLTLEQLGITNEPIARFNHWPSLQERNCAELAVKEEQYSTFESVFTQLNIDFETTRDVPGFVSARILASIINEAFFALEENVSTKAEIDTAMKLGTNYPKGPFEWCNAIGSKTVYALLHQLSAHELRYTPASLLKKAAYEQ
ncbi:MAG: hypothetical protein K2X48_17085 [Chitinophagaceae bacterium]|nr:hypothetical protein [Chitinophagaceae bacterium]